MKPLLPSLKERKRYILFKVASEREAEEREVSKCVTQACLQFLGEFGVAQAGIQFLPETWDMKTQTGVIRVGHKFTNHVKAALALVKEINGRRTTIQCQKVSGMIDKLR